MSIDHTEKLIKDHRIEYVDLRFTDMRGVQHHVTFPANIFDESLFEDGKMFDGSSIAGWKAINESDMILMPDTANACMDPFSAKPHVLFYATKRIGGDVSDFAAIKLLKFAVA